MKVCHIITRMIVGGAQENTLLSARGLYENGHEVVLLTGPSPGPEGELLKQSGELPFRVVTCPHLCRAISPWHDFMAYRFLVDFFRREKFDVVHTHSSKAGILGRYAAESANVPVIVHTIHGLPFSYTLYPRWKNEIYVFLERVAARHCTKILAVAQNMIDQCLEHNIGTPDLFQVVRSGMDMTPFLTTTPDAELRHELNIPEGVPVVATLARLFYGKGCQELWRCIPEILQDVPNAHFLIIGNGILKDTLEQQAIDGGFRSHISFAGLVPPQQVPRYLALADILVHFSRREGLPRAAVQALAMGKPVVAYDVDGTGEVVLDGKTGFLIRDLETPTPGVPQITALLSDPDKRHALGEAGRKLVYPQFDWHLMSDKLIDIYQNLLQERNV